MSDLNLLTINLDRKKFSQIDEDAHQKQKTLWLKFAAKSYRNLLKFVLKLKNSNNVGYHLGPRQPVPYTIVNIQQRKGIEHFYMISHIIFKLPFECKSISHSSKFKELMASKTDFCLTQSSWKFKEVKILINSKR